MSRRGSEESKPPKRIIDFNLDDNLEIRNGGGERRLNINSGNYFSSCFTQDT